MKNEEPVLVLFDQEEEYTFLMSDYLKGQKGVPWKIRSYTRQEDLLECEKDSSINMLVISESSLSEQVKGLNADKIVILNESGFQETENMTSVSKYQAADEVLHMLLEMYLEIASADIGILPGKGKTGFIGIYSPVKRSLQTGFALAMSEILSEKTRTLYLSFEHYCGVADIMPGDKGTDLSDLVYFLNSDSEKFRLHFESIVRQRGNLNYVPPMRSGQNLLTITSAEWKNLLCRINESGLYDFVIMDLTDSMQGLFEILRECKYVYTVMKEDRFAQVKMMQYEQMLNMYEYKDVMDKTIKFVMPKFQYVPDTLEQFTRGEFSDYVRHMVGKMEVC